MNNLIHKIINNENIASIFSYVLDNIYRNGPVDTSDLEILTYISLFNKDFFNSNLDKVLNFMGVFYKNGLTSNSLEEVVFGQYRKYINEKYNNYYTPLQSQILHKIENNKCYSFSAPTSTGKSFVFLKKINESKNDVLIVVPSRALINEYLLKLYKDIEDKSINILPFIDKINTKKAKKNIFVVTPERCRELFKLKNEFKIELILFDEAQLSNENSTRGLLFDGIVRRCYKNFSNATFIFAHPFVKNPSAQLVKNKFEYNEDDFKQFTQKNVGQIFFVHPKSSSNFYHFGIDKTIMGSQKILASFDPVKDAINNNGSVLFYVSKTSIMNNTIFTEFEEYIELCDEHKNEIVEKYLEELIDYTGGKTDLNKDYYSKLITYLKRGIVIHHGSLPLKIRSILEKYTNEGFCRICFATSTLEQGVNMPFDLVYLNKLDGSKRLSVKNLIGRAGRSTELLKFDYGSVVVKDMSGFRKIMKEDEVLNEKSLLDIFEPNKDDDYNDFKDAINNESFDDDLNLTKNQVQRLSTNKVFIIIKNLLDIIFENNEIISLELLNKDVNEKFEIYDKFQEVYSEYLGRELNHGEQNAFNTAIKIILWKVHEKTFKNICWYRYSFASQSNLRRIYKNSNQANILPAKFFTRCPKEFPDKNLTPYNALNGILAKDVDYDFIISDTYDYIDKLIGFKLIDVLYTSLIKYNEKQNDIRAIKLSKFIKYGTDNERHILMLRYGLTFEDIEIFDSHIESITEEEINVKKSIYELSELVIEPIKRYI